MNFWDCASLFQRPMCWIRGSRYLILRNVCMFLGGFLFEYCLFFLLKFSVFSVRKLVQSGNNGFETFGCRKKWVCGNGFYSSRLKDKFDKLQKVFLSYFVFPLLWFSFLLVGDPLCTFHPSRVPNFKVEFCKLHPQGNFIKRILQVEDLDPIFPSAKSNL